MHAHLKNECTEDEKCHNLMTWLIFPSLLFAFLSFYFDHFDVESKVKIAMLTFKKSKLLVSFQPIYLSQKRYSEIIESTAVMLLSLVSEQIVWRKTRRPRSHCFPFCVHRLDVLLLGKAKATLFKF